MKSIEILIASKSVLKKLITTSTNKIRIIDISNTPISTLYVLGMPELMVLSVQDSLIRHLDMRQNLKL